MLRSLPCRFVVVAAVFAGISVAVADPPTSLSEALIFHAPFDETLDATKGEDRLIYTAETLERKVVTPGNHRSDVSLIRGAGRHGDAVRFSDNSPKVLLYQGVNTAYREQDWSGTVSLWLKLDPDTDLKPGYCDPIQITDKTWNNAAFFVDFDKDLPRAFRLGVFSDYKFWNPKDTPWEQIAPEQRPMVPVSGPPFSRSKWTHVAWTFENLNSSKNETGHAALYLNGILQGSLKQPLRFEWDPSKAAIMIGIAYIGDMDDFAIFNRALAPGEIKSLFDLPHGAGGL